MTGIEHSVIHDCSVVSNINKDCSFEIISFLATLSIDFFIPVMPLLFYYDCCNSVRILRFNVANSGSEKQTGLALVWIWGDGLLPAPTGPTGVYQPVFAENSPLECFPGTQRLPLRGSLLESAETRPF